MNDRKAGNGGTVAMMQKRDQFTFWKWNALFLASYGASHVILVVLAGLALNLNLGAKIWPDLFFPMLGCGFVGSALMYWSRQSYDQPKAGAIRLALAILVFLNLYLGILIVSALKLGILSSRDALNSYAPYILPTSILGSIAVYMVARRSLETSQSK